MSMNQTSAQIVSTYEMGAERQGPTALEIGVKNGLRHRKLGWGSARIAVWKNTTTVKAVVKRKYPRIPVLHQFK